MKHLLAVVWSVFLLLHPVVVVVYGGSTDDDAGGGADIVVEDDEVLVKSESRRRGLRFRTTNHANKPRHQSKENNRGGNKNDSSFIRQTHNKTTTSRNLLSTSCGYGNYFCFKTIDEIFIVMTHNSLALPGRVLSPNQNFGLKQQFRAGIRGFNFDLYTAADGTIVTRHGGTVMGYNPVQEVQELVNEIAVKENEFVIILLQDAMQTRSRNEFVTWFGPLLITSFDPNKNLGDYMVQGQRILLVTDNQSNVAAELGVHSTYQIITENDYQWRSCYLGEPSMTYRRGPKAKQSRSAKLLNSFCSLSGAGNPVASSSVNAKSRILYNIRNYVKQDYTNGKINILMVDYYETGNVFDAQTAMRAGNMYDNCEQDGSSCIVGNTCWNCCSNTNEYWSSKLVTACGAEPCWKPGTVCGIGSTCSNCCRGGGAADCRWYHLGVCTCHA